LDKGRPSSDREGMVVHIWNDPFSLRGGIPSLLFYDNEPEIFLMWYDPVLRPEQVFT